LKIKTLKGVDGGLATPSSSLALIKKISIQNISKTFGSTRANINISFDIAMGSIHSIVGQNGAGKSTLMKVLYGLENADQGTIAFDSQVVSIRSPRESLDLGIGLVQQELSLVDELTALENLILGNEPIKQGRLDLSKAEVMAQQIQRNLDLKIPWHERTSKLQVAQKQQIEILRLLSRGAEILIFDEPTAVLAPKQIQALLDLLLKLKSDGKTILFISHKVLEVLAISDSITVLRAGEHVGTFPRGDISESQLAELIIGEKIADAESTYGTNGDVILSADGISYRSPEGVTRVNSVSIDFRASHITGICGVAGNGQEEFVRMLIGILRSNSGSIRLEGREIGNASIGRRRAAGMSYISSDRKNEGLAALGTITENSIGGFQKILEKFGWLSKKGVARHTQLLLERYDVKHSDLNNPISSLSGGNQQRLMVGREILHEPKVLIASQPSRGVDLGGVSKIHELLRAQRDFGTSIVLASEDLDELMELSDSIAVFYNGEVIRVFDRPFDRRLIGNAMLGLRDNE
jgi:ABC-type uncharacterized transport system ATPase subunit